MTSEPAQTATSPASGPLWTKPGSLRPTSVATIVPPAIAISELTATRPEILSSVCALITLKPNQPTREHPGAEGQERDARRRMGADGAVLAVAVAARAEQEHGGERDPAADRVDDDAAGEVVELGAGRRT